jgi:nucleotide-binding universal stress UspA family protein
MVHLQPGRSNTAVLAMTRRLAERFRASVIGIAVSQPMQMDLGDGSTAVDIYALDRDEIAGEVHKAEVEFRSALHAAVPNLQWRSASLLSSLSGHLAREARCADLFLTAVDASSYFDNMRRVDTGDLIMQIGRPVLLVPTSIEKIELQRVLVGWKDSREARRAVVDALPLLRTGSHVSLVEIRSEQDPSSSECRLADVAAWLHRHGIAAECLSSPPADDDAGALYTIAQDRGIDLTVAGAYGHSRLREWVLGGVTRDLLVGGNRCALVSH